MTDKVQRIREEVERLKGWNNNVRNSTRHMTLQEEDFNRGKHSSYLEILNFIDSLQEEHVSEDLEEAAVEAFKQIVDSDKNNFLEIFKAGAEWGRNQAMAEIQAQSIALAHGCPEESANEDLKKAADNALESISDQYDIISVGSCLEMFRLGAKWQLNRLQKQKDGK